MTVSKQSQDGVHCPDSAWKRSSKPAWNLPVSNVQWKAPDDGQRRCPKHVEFYNRINLDKLRRLVDYLKRNLKLLSTNWPTCRPSALLHIIPSSDLSATIGSVSRLLLVHEISAALTTLGDVSLLVATYHYTVKPRFTNASDHEQFGLRTNFPNTKRLGWRTVSRVTNTQAVNIMER